MSHIPKLRISTLPYENKLIVDAFQANQLISGPHIDILEKGLTACFDYKYANTTASGFAGLFLALKSLKLKKAKVVVPAVSTCQAITNAVLANGFEIVFCDISPNHLSLSESSLADLFRKNQIDVIIAPSHFGIPAPMETYKMYGVPVIEDACQAFFTRTTVKSTADIMVLSFYPTKQFNCIEGGAILHNSLEKNLQIEDMRYYEHQNIYDGTTRYNLRMSNLHAAFGCLLLNNLTHERNKLLTIWDNYMAGIHRKNLLLDAQCQNGVIPWRVLIKANDTKLFEQLRLADIQTDIELIGLQKPSSDVIQHWFNKVQSVPYFSTLTLDEQNFIIKCINEWN